MDIEETYKALVGIRRQSDLYKKMTPYEACAIAEGFDGEDHTQDEELTAWQWLHDTKLAYSLQGWYGRTAQGLIKEGCIDA